MSPVELWTPPAGMLKPVATEWRSFYRHIYATYAVAPQDYRDLYLAQRGRCYICREAKGKHPDDPKGRGARRLGVDHNHAIGYGRREAVRALLCTGGDRTCNRIIGWLGPEALKRGAEVLETAPAQDVFLAGLQYEDAAYEIKRDDFIGASLAIGPRS